MSDAPLLLSPAKTAVLVHTREARLRLAAALFGALVVLVGAADLTTRAAHAVFGESGAAVAFAPAIVGANPALFAGAATSTALVPARLRIPAIGVNAPVEQVAQKADGTMGTPTKFGDVAWYAPGAKPGAAGSAVFAGHVDNALTTAGIFEHLSQLKAGDYVTVEDASGKSVVYRVTSSKSYPANQAPLADIFATTGPSRLALITCTGDWVTSEHQFDQRLVVIAQAAY
jgi:LPXTG-site transpeptidase (sortase) family protein